MRFVSKYGRLWVQIRPQVQEAYATGMAKVVQEPLYAQFEVVGLLPYERELAIAKWGIAPNGFYQEADEVTVVPPDYRLGLFDSVRAASDQGWSEQVRIEVEETLADLAERFDHIVVVPASAVPPPWPRYDEYRGAPTALVRKLVDEGHDLEQTLIYEQATLGRGKVIAEIEKVLADPELLASMQPEPDVEEVIG